MSMQTLESTLLRVDMECTRWRLMRKRTQCPCVAQHCSGRRLTPAVNSPLSPLHPNAVWSQWGIFIYGASLGAHLKVICMTDSYHAHTTSQSDFIFVFSQRWWEKNQFAYFYLSFYILGNLDVSKKNMLHKEAFISSNHFRVPNQYHHHILWFLITKGHGDPGRWHWMWAKLGDNVLSFTLPGTTGKYVLCQSVYVKQARHWDVWA